MYARLTAGLALTLVFVLGGKAHGDISPLSQLRQVVAAGNIVTLDENVDFYDSVEAMDFGLFDDSTGLALRTQLGSATADGFAKQLSNITPTEMTLFASADAFAFTISGDDASFAGTASNFSVQFTIDVPAF